MHIQGVILKWVFDTVLKGYDWIRVSQDWNQLGCHNDEPFDSVKCGQFLYCLSN